MNGFVSYISTNTSLKKLEQKGRTLKPLQSNDSADPDDLKKDVDLPEADKVKATLKVYSPSEQIVEQAKANLKKTAEEEIISAPGGFELKPVKPSKGSKSAEIHKRYKKRGRPKKSESEKQKKKSKTSSKKD